MNEKAADPLGSDRSADLASGIDRDGRCPAGSLLQRLRAEHRRMDPFQRRDTIHREPSGYLGSGYASGIASASGSYHARLGLDQNPDTCPSGGGPQPIHRGPSTNWGGYSSIFPTGGYQTRLDIYLDTAWAATNFDRRFDWSSAVTNTSGNHRRDFVFNAGTEPTGFVISASNNGDSVRRVPSQPGPHAHPHRGIGVVYVRAHLCRCPGQPSCCHPPRDPEVDQRHPGNMGTQRCLPTSSEPRSEAIATAGSSRTRSTILPSTTASEPGS